MIRQEKRRLDGPYEKQVTESWDTEAPQRGDIVYLHGGGLLFGTRDDLPAYHLEQLTRAGFRVLALDYPLAPNAKLPQILEDILCSVNTAAPGSDHRRLPRAGTDRPRSSGRRARTAAAPRC